MLCIDLRRPRPSRSLQAFKGLLGRATRFSTPSGPAYSLAVPDMQPHPVGAPSPGKKGGKVWARFLMAMGLAVLALSTLAVGCFSARNLLRYQKYNQWPKATARYDGISSKTTGSGRSRTRRTVLLFVRIGRLTIGKAPLRGPA